MRLALVVCLFLLASMLAACALLDPTNDFAITIEPDRRVYVLSDTTRVRLRIRNHSAATIHLDGCGLQRFERLDQGRLTGTWTVDRSCECVCEVSLERGEEIEMSTSVREMRSMAGELETEAAKSYRFLPVMYFREKTSGLSGLVDRAEIGATAFRFTTESL